MVHAVLAPRLVCVHEDLGIGPRAKAVPQTLQMGAERLEVIDLAVQGAPARPGLAGDRLITRLRADDAQASAAQGEEGVNVETRTVGAAIGQRLSQSPRRATATAEAPALSNPSE